MNTPLLTDRLSLDPLTLDDDVFILELLNSKGWMEFIGDRKIHTKDAAIAYINKISDAPTSFYWAVRLKDAQLPMGVISFLKRDYLDHYDIGFAFLPQFFAKGYAFEASDAVLKTVRANPAYQHVSATTMPGNLQSIKLLTKLGLQFDREIVVGEDLLHVYII
jgi:RimJ/RimL family protein N-acetyltransferase